ncbi:MAG: sulfatase-like hydrolase/transferase [Gemmatimonadetes bacterium]|nr:sulfatase-like hydrolase/transferase [Gemmatimonadota bacterium]
MCRRPLPLLLLLVACSAEPVGGPLLTPRASRVEVAPAADTLAALGDTVILAATAFDSAGLPMAAAFQWRSLDAAVATVDRAGRVIAVRDGTTGIEVSGGGRADTARITVRQVAVGVAVPAADTLRPGWVAQYAAAVVDARGAPLPGAPIRWRSSDPAVATVDSAGVARAVAAGEAALLAVGAGFTDTLRLTVLAGGAAPDIVLILANDLRADRVAGLPVLDSLFGRSAVSFTRAYAPRPGGSPSRATLLTGQLPRTHGVRTSLGPGGGAAAFEGQATLATWLGRAGYRTAYVGTWLDEPARLLDPTPDAWDEWIVLWGGTLGAAQYYDYTLNANGRLTRLGRQPAVYSTTLLADSARAVVRRAPAGAPLFLVLAPYAPAFPSTPAPGDSGAFAGGVPVASPAFNEADVSDKPSWVRQQPALAPRELAREEARREDYQASLLAVDRAAGALVAQLAASRPGGPPVVVLTADAGAMQGEHRLWSPGGGAPYEEQVRVPLLLRAPGILGGVDSSLASLADLAPTLMELAGAPVPAGREGTSLVPRLRTRGAAGATALYLEYAGEDASTPADRRFRAVRTATELYVEYVNGERELYDLAADPFELTNLAGDPREAGRLDRLARLLARLAGP